MLNIKLLVEKLEKVIAQEQQTMVGMPPMPTMPAADMQSSDDGMMDMSSDDGMMDMPSPLVPSSVDQDAKDMFTGDINSMIVNASDILAHIEQGKEIEPWMQGKITLASDYVSAVRDYLIGNKE